MRFLVTAGNTREMIDKVRAWGNIFTGNTGYAIAKALAELGDVDLITSNAAHLAELDRNSSPHRIHGTHFSSHAELRKALSELMQSRHYDAVFMTAAVADYKPTGAFNVIERKPLPDGTEQWTVQSVSAGKVKSSYREIAFLGQQTEKLIDLFRTEWNYKGLLVKFKLEVEQSDQQLLAIAKQSRIASSADYIVANTLEMVQGTKPGAYLIGADSDEWIPRNDLPTRLVQLTMRHCLPGEHQSQP